LAKKSGFLPALHVVFRLKNSGQPGKDTPMQSIGKSVFADPLGAPSLIRRVVAEHGAANWRRYVAVLVLMALAAAATAASAVFFGDIVNQAYLRKDFQALVFLCGVIILISLVKGASTYGSAVQLARIANRIVAENERRMFEKLLHENLGFFADRHSSEFMARLTTGAAAASQTLSLLITAVGRDLLSLIGLVTVMVVQDPAMSLVTLVIAPPIVLVMRKLVRRARTVIMTKYTSGIATLETLQEALQGIRTVKAFTLEETMRVRAQRSIAAVESAANKMARVSNRSGPLMEALAGVAIALAILYGGYRVINTGAKPGAFVSFMAAFLLAYEPAKRLARLNFDLSHALLGVRLFYELMDSPASEPSELAKTPLILSTGRVEFRNVAFAYRPGEPVIKDMTFTAEPGRTTALVGPSGGGKSTILSLILRFYEAAGGAIEIDDQNIATRSRQSLRQQISYVGQDVFLFRGTIRENIALGKPGATEDEIVAAAKAAHAHEFIMASALGYDTPVGEHGMQLSGGERQRVSVARALIKDAPIVLLDEPTASLDSESERLVQEAIAHLCQGRTTLVIAHRLHTIVRADRILVIEDGTITESGRHDELLRHNGRYASFYRLQLRNQEADEADPREAPRDDAPREPIAVASPG
jgi:ATP-binding cassette, subfamily B, bacterial MsbA